MPIYRAGDRGSEFLQAFRTDSDELLDDVVMADTDNGVIRVFCRGRDGKLMRNDDGCLVTQTLDVPCYVRDQETGRINPPSRGPRVGVAMRDDL